jgi:hypothetical protein
MAEHLIVLTEVQLVAGDVAQITGLMGTDAQLQVLFAAPDDAHPLIEALDRLALAQFHGALDALRHRGEAAGALSAAWADLHESLAVCRAAGLTADGTVITGDPAAALVKAVGGFKAGQVVLVTKPHLVGDAIHDDWAAKVRRTIGVPVVHIYGGTTRMVI